ncbi:MAG: hypothetical protein U0136_13795 [Bdellovibrionota bacterium]
MTAHYRFDFHGVTVDLATDSHALGDALRRDFSYFLLPGDANGTAASIRIFAGGTPFTSSDLPFATSENINPRCITFNEGGVRWVSYLAERCIARWDFKKEAGEVRGEDADLLYEITYLLILSRVGELLDRKGLHRVHASAVSVGGRAVLVVMPSGGGKTTLACAAMTLPKARLLSDDAPLVSLSGEVLAFPSRLGLLQIPDEAAWRHRAREFHRRENGTKYLVDVEIFEGRLETKASPGILIFGSRKLRGACGIRPVGKLFAARRLFAALVVGVGLPQVIEYFLRFEIRDMLAKCALVFSRMRAALSLLKKSELFLIELGPDRTANIEVFLKLLSDRLAEVRGTEAHERPGVADPL